MSPSVSRNVLDVLLPQGYAWGPSATGDLTKLFDGVAANWETVREEMSQLAFIRNAGLTPILSDLEREYGILPDTSLPESTRRQRLKAIQTASDNDGSASFLQDILTNAGFDVQVHINNPPVNPASFLTEVYNTRCGQTDAVCGNESAVCGGGSNGELIINGDLVYHPQRYSTICGKTDSVCGNDDALTGAYGQPVEVPIEYDIPTEPGYWPLFFFVGGDATRNPATGELTQIANAEIDGQRREEIRRLIVQYKPMHSWAGLVATFV